MCAIMNTRTEALKRIQTRIGPKGWVESAEDMQPYLVEQRNLYRGQAAAVVKPASTEETADIVDICAEAGIVIVPQGGNTGLVGGGVPLFNEDTTGIVLSMERMNRVLGVDALNQTLTVEAGVILSQAQSAAEEAGLLFPLSLAAEGSCRIGGNIATNAGGIHVLHYGNTRALILGLEVVLPDGRIWNGLRALRKDNTGYDLKQLFIGSEGTLGIITAAVLKLSPRPAVIETGLCAARDADAVLELFGRARRALGESLTAFEIINRFAFDITKKNIPGIVDPFAEGHEEYALIEVSGAGTDLRHVFETCLHEAVEEGVIQDAVIAESGEQVKDLWHIRESIPEAQKSEGGSIKHDVAVPISAIGTFLQRARKAVEDAIPGVRICCFGHLGDGNLHYNLSQPVNADKDAYLDRWGEINGIVHNITMELGGSFSAEHGIGCLKTNDLRHYKSDVEIDMMRMLKQTLDPLNIMNPGKVIP